MSEGQIAEQVRRRRTFAIISHPDAGKTTLTEKLLLFSGAIHIAGSVKARKATRHATSDWMEIEKQRGISVASSVMQMLYRDCVINLLDTPGHRDFSEDTYRVLTAVDSALMVIDAANGVEPQTRRLIEVCRQRGTPIMTFVNKMDREGKEPLALLDEIEQELGMPCVPMTWPVGQGKAFGGIVDLRKRQMRLFKAGADKRNDQSGAGSDELVMLAQAGTLRQRFGHDYEQAEGHMELLREAAPAFDAAAFVAAHQTPVFFGSGVNNFGVQEVLDALVDLAPPPAARHVTRPDGQTDEIDPAAPGFSGVVFKVQANMDPSHRDRIAFVRVNSGRYGSGMKLRVQRNAKELRPTSVVTFLSQRREAVDEAYAGDIIGFTTHGGVQLGDTITDGDTGSGFGTYTGLPFFAPELFQTVELANPIKSKQLQQGLLQLGEEGAIQVFRPTVGGAMLLGAVGQLQFEVVQHRLKAEYGVDVRLSGSRFHGARWVTCDDDAAMRKFTDEAASKLALDAADTLAYLMTSPYDLRLTQERHPLVVFHPLREHAGLALQTAG
ncbi:peptide chain release factor 3 [Methylibium sp.]|uniref:peptide chain release factor 3 n=1 Tax=Methylibium sp. TaxID=2067992 RepID=UPI00286A435F|nr:peptide chain release factor 3 [Methylibium sp.]